MPSTTPLLALRMAWRGLRRDPVTSWIAAGILALGLAAPAVFFSLLVGSVRPLPVPEGRRIVRIEVLQPSSGGAPLPVTGADVRSWQGVAGAEAIGGFEVLGGTLVDPGRNARSLSIGRLTGQVLPLLRVEPVAGRIPTGGERDPTLLISEDLWEELYDRDPSALGRVVTVDGRPHTLVGVMPAGFGFPFRQNAWITMDAEDGAEPLEAVARLADGGSAERLAAELNGRWRARDPLRDPSAQGGLVVVRPYTGGRGESGEAAAFLGLTVVGLCLLFIACANVANLLLVRATERVRTLSIQAALGATPARIAMQLFMEALLLATAGGVGGLLLATASVDLIQRTLAAEHFGYFWMRMAVDAAVVGFTAVLVLTTALVAGTLPIMRVRGMDVQRVIRDEASGGEMMGGGGWSRAFVTLQLALSCAALVAAGLTGRALAEAARIGAGLPSKEVLVAELALPAGGGPPLRSLVERVAAVPGVKASAVALGAPGYFEPFGDVRLDREANEEEPGRFRGTWNAVTPGFFDAFDLELRSGRSLDWSDGPGSRLVAVVNESFVRRHEGAGTPIGQVVRIDGRAHEIVGVVGDATVGRGPRARNDRVYVPLAQVEGGPDHVLLLARGPAGATVLTPDVRTAVVTLDPRIAVDRVRTLDDAFRYLTRVPRSMSAIAVAGGLAGQLVALVGLYGLLAFRVRRRRREFGIHMALGAPRGRLAAGVVIWALRQMVPALALGLSAAWLVSPALGAMLLGLNPRDPLTYAAVAATFLVVGVATALAPAVRASSVDPAGVLRQD